MTEMSRERREKLERRFNDVLHDGALEQAGIKPRDIQALLRDSAWRERVEPTLKEIERFGHNEGHGCGYSCVNMAQQAIVDTGDEEGE